jgi:hypothetical protein
MSDFSTALVEDERLQLTPDVSFGVFKGAATIAPTKFPATGQPSSSAHQYMVTVPSLENVVDRCILWHCQFTLTFTPSEDLAVGNRVLDFNGLDALAPFPLQQFVTTMSVQINSTQTNINMQDMLPSLLYMVGRDELAKWNNMTPTYLDNYAQYTDAVSAQSVAGLSNINNPLGTYANGVDPCYVPRGSWAFDNVVNPAAAAGALRPTASVTVTVTEPLLISPLLFGLDGVGLQGVNQINMQINIDPVARRVWRRSPRDSANALRPTLNPIDVAFTANQCYMEVSFLTPSPYQLAKYAPRNVVDFYQLDRYITTVGAIASGATGTCTTQSVQLAQIPDKLIFVIKEQYSELTNIDADCFATIENVSINFNAKQNILAQASKQLIYKYCKEAGSNQTYLEFSGLASIGNNAGVQKVVGTTGSVLVLDFGKHIDIPEMYLSNSSAGQYNLQLTVQYKNNTGSAFVNAQGVLIIMNSGVFSTERGQSQVFTSLLNKDAVMAVLDEKPSTNSELKRLIGGSWLSSLMRVGKAIAPVAKDLLRSTGNKYASAGADLIGALGYGRSAGGRSAGGVSGGLKAHMM